MPPAQAYMVAFVAVEHNSLPEAADNNFVVDSHDPDDERNPLELMQIPEQLVILKMFSLVLFPLIRRYDLKINFTFAGYNNELKKNKTNCTRR